MIAEGGHRTPWCIVVADNHGPEWVPTLEEKESCIPVQYSRLGGSTTLIQRALQRATRIAPVSQVMVTVLEEYRHYWESALWFVRPEHRLVSENRVVSSLTAAAAILSIAAKAHSQIVAVIPGRCYVAQEALLAAAIDKALTELPGVPEGVLSLAMIDGQPGIDEDYLLVQRSGPGPLLQVFGRARRPAAWVASSLRRQGALIASGLMIGYADVFAAHISRQWPGLTQALIQLVRSASTVGVECEIPLHWCRGVPRAALSSLGWYSSSLRQQALCVSGSGWSSLGSAKAVARIIEYLESLAKLEPVREGWPVPVNVPSIGAALPQHMSRSPVG
jgi:mannose-1-phosphate guanylyltransferase